MGLVLNIQRFCVHDGPGIRTTVFLKGCPLNCLWCHNPESKSNKKILAFNPRLCINCSNCFSSCSNHKLINNFHYIDRINCIACGKCVDECNGSLSIYGQEMTKDRICKEIMKDIEFYKNSKGGITISGGEPLLNYKFAKEILIEAKKQNIHTCIETSGYASWETIEELSPYIDLFLWDIKELDNNLHKKFTGVDNKLILENLFKLNKLKKKIILRCPLIPGYNLREDHLRNIGLLAEELDSVIQIELLPYHTLGKEKYQEINEEYKLVGINVPSSELIEKCISFISKYTKKTIKKV